jgi:hypothetical protein
VSRPRREVKGRCSSEDGVSVLEYVLLVTLVAMICCGALIYLGRGSASPAHAANDAGNDVVSATNLASGGVGDALGGSGGAAASPLDGTQSRASVEAWCTSGETGCRDPMLMNGQSEIIHFWATGGSGMYSYQLQGSVPPFVVPDWPNHEITVSPTDCASDPGTYAVSLVVSDTAGDTGTLDFTLTVSAGSLCQT